MENFCLYCFTKKDLNKMHLFPEVIGGRIQDKWCCAKCNSSIGTSVEGDIKKHLFFAHCIVETGIDTPDEAFKLIRIREQESGERMKFINGVPTGTAKMRSPKERVAPPKEMRRLIINDVRKKYPEELERYIKEYDAGKRTIRIGNEEHVFREEKGRAKIEFGGKAGVPISLLAKIAYEGVWLFQQFGASTLQDFYKEIVRVERDSDGNAKRVGFAKSLRKRVSCLRPDIADGRTPLETITPRRYHRLDFRVTEKGIAYVVVTFFGVLPYLVVMGSVSRADARNSEWLDKAYFFSTERSEIVPEEYPEEYGEVLLRNNVLAEVLWHKLTSDHL